MQRKNERRAALTAGGIVVAGVTGFCGLAVLALARAGGGLPAGVLADPYLAAVLRFTVLQAVLSTLFSVVLGLAVARSLARQARFAGRVWLIRLLAVPMGLPVLVGALGLLAIWGRNGAMNAVLTGLGLSDPVSVYGLSGILIAHVFFNMPLAARLFLQGLERLPPESFRNAASLGMSGGAVFRHVEWPVLRPVLPGIAGLIFMLCLTSFTLVLMLGGGPAATTLEVAIYQALRFDFDPPRAGLLALMQIALTLAFLLALSRFPRPPEDEPASGRSFGRPDGTRRRTQLADGLVLLLAAGFTGLPLLAVLVDGLKAPFGRLLAEAAVHRAVLHSLLLASAAGLLAVLASLGAARAEEALRAAPASAPARLARGLLDGVGTLVLLVPPVVIGTGWFLMLRPDPASPLVPAIVIGINAVMALPFVHRVLAPAYRSHRARTGRLAESLGITGWSRLRQIDGPGLARPILMGLSFAMALSLGDLGAVALFGSDRLTTLPWLVYSRLGSYRTDDAAGLALLLGLVCLVLTVLGTGKRQESEA